MVLSEGRIHRGRATPYPWERAALDIVYRHESISDTDPHQAWELYELYDPASGRLYEIDLLFLSRQGLFLVEIKSHPLMGYCVRASHADLLGNISRDLETETLRQ